MNKEKKPFCVWFALFMCIAGLLALIIVPSTGRCSTGDATLTGDRLVKARLDHMEQTSKQAKPGMKVYVIQPGDNLCSILEKAGVAKKDALYISKKADRAFKLRKMRPGTSLKLYFSPDYTALYEVEYNVSGSKKVILYNGRIIKLAGSSAITGSTAEQNGSSNKSGEKQVSSAPKPSRAISEPLQAVKTPASANAVVPEQSGPNPAAVPDTAPANMKLLSSYNCNIPEEFPDSYDDKYGMLANGLVLTPLLPSPEDGAPACKQEKSSLKHKKDVAAKKRKSCIVNSDQDGFLRAPLAYRRVSSGYSYERLNPITNVEAPHLGIDYSAPTGTPVHSIGSGRVLFYGWNGGYGKTVRIQHSNGYISQYAHLSRFSHGILPGKRVRKGETIGYVGMTGLATGPHLDFRIVYKGSYINPQRVEGSTRRISSKSGRTHRISRG